MKTFFFAILSLVLLIGSIVATHFLLFAWSMAGYVAGLVCLGIFAWQCDRQSEQGRG